MLDQRPPRAPQWSLHRPRRWLPRRGRSLPGLLDAFATANEMRAHSSIGMSMAWSKGRCPVRSDEGGCQSSRGRLQHLMDGRPSLPTPGHLQSGYTPGRSTSAALSCSRVILALVVEPADSATAVSSVPRTCG